MWLIPSSIQSRFAAASGCSILDLTADLNTSASEFARLCTVSGKHTQQASYLRSWKRDAWTQRLFGRTLQPSMHGHFVEWWTSLLVDSPANHTALPGSSKDSATDAATAKGTDPSRTPCESLKSVSHPWSGLKTYLPGFEEDSSSQSQKDYASWVTQSLDHSLSLRRTLAHRTNGNAHLSWLSGREEGNESCGNHPGATDSLTGAIKKWATPDCNTATYSNGHMGPNLREQVANWPTPAARDEKGANSQEHATVTGGGRKHMDQLANFVAHSHQAQAIQDGPPSSTDSPDSARRLNPAFGCWLMGLPWFWTNPGVTSCVQSEMGQYRWHLQQRLSILCGDSHD